MSVEWWEGHLIAVSSRGYFSLMLICLLRSTLASAELRFENIHGRQLNTNCTPDDRVLTLFQLWSILIAKLRCNISAQAGVSCPAVVGPCYCTICGAIWWNNMYWRRSAANEWKDWSSLDFMSFSLLSCSCFVSCPQRQCGASAVNTL